MVETVRVKASSWNDAPFNIEMVVEVMFVSLFALMDVI